MVLSIIIPTYNEAAIIRAESALKLFGQNFEIIVSDGIFRSNCRYLKVSA
jgi:glycosyltransferase involved in cell wall biosynthesis